MSGEQANVTNVVGSTSSPVTVTADEQAAANAAARAADGPSAAKFGVSDEQFRKFYDADKSVYNWEGHAKDAEYRAKQSTPPADPAPADDAGTSDAEATTAIAKAGLDFGVLESQVVESGDIGEAEYKALADIGIPEAIVKEYIANIQSRAADQVAEVMDAFGGEGNLNIVKEYAQKNYTIQEMEDIDRKLADPKQYKATVDMLRYQAGIKPDNVGQIVLAPNALGGGMDGVKGYANDAELQADIRNPKYKTDPAFRQEVTRKVAAAKYTTNPRAHVGGL